MSFVRACQAILLTTALAAVPAFASRAHRPATSGHSHRHRTRRHSTRHHVARGQRGISPERATQIQTALIKQNYMTGTPSGEWDDETEAAMKKYQDDHGWQTKSIPDSRALIALGLGPDHSEDGVPVVAAAKAPAPAAAAVPAPNTLASTHIIQN